MNRNILHMAFILGILAGGISSNSLRDSSIEDDSSSEKGDSLLSFMESILQDPEYLSLSDYEQLADLEDVYSLLESSNSRPQRTSKHHGINEFLNFRQEQNKLLKIQKNLDYNSI